MKHIIPSMWLPWKTSTSHTLGIDIDDHTLRLVHLETQGTQIVTHKVLALPMHETSEFPKTELIVQTLQKACTQLNYTGITVVLAVPDTLTLQNSCSINTEASRWKDMALLSVAPYVPLPIDHLYYDFQIVDTPSPQRVLGVFCLKTVIEEKQKLMKQCSLNCNTIEVESHALERAMRHLYDLNQYPSVWVFILMKDSSFIMTLWSTNTLIAVWSDTLEQIDDAQAIFNQLKQCLNRCLFTYTRERLETIWIGGSHSHKEYVEKNLHDMFELPYKEHVVFPSSFQLSSLSEEFYIAVGLALRAFTT